jgi:hypothetical protein
MRGGVFNARPAVFLSVSITGLLLLLSFCGLKLTPHKAAAHHWQVGYGDIVPENSTEMVFATISVMMGATSCAYVTAAVTSLVVRKQSFSRVALLVR